MLIRGGQKLALCCLLVILCGCEGLLFFPQRQLLRTPAELGLAYQSLNVTTTDGTVLHGWWLPAAKPALATLLFFHGNAENISTHIASVAWLPARGVNVLAVDYRGYGQSAGQPSITGALSDIDATLNYLATDVEQQRLPWFVLGQSLGASLSGVAVARRLPELENLAGVILDAGFSRYADIASEVAAAHPLTWALQYPAAWSMPKGYDLLDAVTQYGDTPLLLIHGRQDTVISYHHMQRLQQAAPQAQSLSYDGGHIQSFGFAAPREGALQFIEQQSERWHQRRRAQP